MPATLEAPSAPVTASLDDRLVRGVLLSVGLRAFVPNLVTLLQTGRPAVAVGIQLTAAGRLVAALCSLATVACLVVAATRTREPRRRSAIGLLALAYLLVSLLGCLQRPGAPIGSALVGACAIAAVCLTDASAATYQRVLTLLCGSCAVASLALAVVAPGVARYAGVHWFSRDARLAGIFGTPNEMGHVAVLGLVAALYTTAVKRSTRTVVLASCTVALVMSQSYTSWAAAVATMLAMTVVKPHAGRRLLALVILAGAALLASRASDYAVDTESGTSGLQDRHVAWDYALAHWTQHPLLGHGATSWAELRAAGIVPRWAVHAHDQPINTLYTAGLLGLLLLGATLLCAARKGLREQGTSFLLALLATEVVRSYTEVPFEVLFGGVNLLVLLVLVGLVRADE